MQKFKATFILTQTPGVNWYRNINYIKHMGIDVNVWPPYQPNKLPNWEEAMAKDTKLMYQFEEAVKDSNIIVCQRVSTYIGLAMLYGIKDKYKKKIWLEIDDDVFHVDSSNPGYSTIYPDSTAYKVFEQQLKVSDGVIVSTDTLKEVYKPYNHNIHIVKNAMNLKQWGSVKKPEENKKLRIGWQGSAHHYEDLNILVDVLPVILKQNKDVEIHFFGDVPDYLGNIGIIKHDVVSIDKYPKKLKELNFDIALAPLHDTQFNRGKSNLRILEYGALRKAVVASWNGNLPYSRTIDNGVNGLLANTKQGWIDCISELINDEKLRTRLGNNLYKKINKEYNVKDWAKVYENILLKYGR